MTFQTIDKAKRLNKKYVLVRLDTNVPMRGKKILDETRLKAALPTLRYLERKKAKIIIISHLGRPNGKEVVSLSLKPIGYALGKLLKRPVKVLPFAKGIKSIRAEADKNIVLLENIRFYKGEDDNSVSLAKDLAKLGNVYINDAFSVSHRVSASLVGLPKLLPSFAGFNLAAEIDALEKIKKAKGKNLVIVVGGAKVADKLPVIKKLLPKAAAVLVGGGVANNFLKAKKISVGKSLVDDSVMTATRSILRLDKKKLVLPIDLICDSTRTKQPDAIWRELKEVKPYERIVDIGPKTCQLYATHIKKAKLVFWSGPLGWIEEKNWSHGTLALARLIDSKVGRHIYALAGGGETVPFFLKHRLTMDYFSTAGSALLEFLAGEKLPALKAIGYKK